MAAVGAALVVVLGLVGKLKRPLPVAGAGAAGVVLAVPVVFEAGWPKTDQIV